VRNETSLGDCALTLPYASVEATMGVLGDLAGKEVLLVGAGRMSELAGECLRSAGATSLKVMNRTLARGEDLALKFGVTSVSCDDRLTHLALSDVVVCSTSCPHSLITLEDGKAIAKVRRQKPLVIIDIAVPRNVDPRVGEIDGVFLFNIDSLEEIVRRKTGQHGAIKAANTIVAEEVKGFRKRLLAERVIPTIVALRQRLEDLCQQEVEYLRKELGPFTEDQDQVLTMLAAHITQRIAGSLARELRELPDRAGQDMLTVAVHRLFSLESSGAAIHVG